MVDLSKAGLAAKLKTANPATVQYTFSILPESVGTQSLDSDKKEL